MPSCTSLRASLEHDVLGFGPGGLCARWIGYRQSFFVIDILIDCLEPVTG